MESKLTHTVKRMSAGSQSAAATAYHNIAKRIRGEKAPLLRIK